MSITAKIIKAAEEVGEDDEAALVAAVVAALDKDDIRVLARTAVANWLRGRVRRREYAAFARRLPTATTPSSSAVTLDERRSLLCARFATPEGRVTWGEATVEQHQSRVQFLTVHKRGVELTIRHHLKAIEMIEAAGVGCLAEVAETGVDLGELAELAA